MPVITSIKQQKNRNRVNVYLDDKFGFGIDLENFVKLDLKVERELTETEVEEIVKKAEFQKTYDKLLKFAMLRPRSEKEIKDWFKRKKVHKSLHKKLFAKLIKLELIDDKKFAEWWVGQRVQFKSKSKRELIQELRTKGIARDIVDETVAGAEIDELKLAKKLLTSKAYLWRNLDSPARRQKATQFLLRRGFGWETVKEVVKGT